MKKYNILICLLFFMVSISSFGFETIPADQVTGFGGSISGDNGTNLVIGSGVITSNNLSPSLWSMLVKIAGSTNLLWNEATQKLHLGSTTNYPFFKGLGTTNIMFGAGTNEVIFPW